MPDALFDKLKNWKDHLKKCDAWDNGDCAAFDLIYAAVENVYGQIDNLIKTEIIHREQHG